MQVNARAVGIASSAIAAATYVVCGVLVAVAPGATSSFFGWVFHIELSDLARQISLVSFIGGLILFSVFVGVCVAGTAWLYNRLTAPSKLRSA